MRKSKGRFSQKMLEELRVEYSKVEKIDPAGNIYPKMCAMLDAMPQADLKQLANARIRFLSSLAQNRVNKEKP